MLKMFKEVFKQFKSKKKTPDLSIAYNFSTDKIPSDKVRPYSIEANINQLKLKQLGSFGLKPPEQWNIYEINEKPGLIFVKNPFTNSGQRYWISRCLRDYPKKPQKTNLDAHNELQNNEDWWETCHSDSIRGPKLLSKLRWITLGYHHNWDTKVYSEDSKDPFPQDLTLMCEYLASVLGFPKFLAQAAIINYYHLDSTLSGHTDHSEPNLAAPLFSLSFGQTAIFLVGGLTLEEKPLAIFLNSGDIIVMSKESRQCYHAVPCIIPTSLNPWDDFNDEKDCFIDNVTDKDLVVDCRSKDFWNPFHEYLKTSRININIRQVLNIGQDGLS